MTYQRMDLEHQPTVLYRCLIRLLCIGLFHGLGTVRPRTIHPQTIRSRTIYPQTIRPRTIRPPDDYCKKILYKKQLSRQLFHKSSSYLSNVHFIYPASI